MDTNDVIGNDIARKDRRTACLIEGCPCRDARIVSHRRARFYAHLAAINGETARRVIAPDLAWRLPGSDRP
jgi:hypothetical protein